MIDLIRRNRKDDLFRVRNMTFCAVDKEYAKIKKRYLQTAKDYMPKGTECIRVEARKDRFHFKDGTLYGRLAFIFVKHNDKFSEDAGFKWSSTKHETILGHFEKEFRIRIKGCVGLAISSNDDAMYLDMDRYGDVDTKLVFFKEAIEV